MKNAPKRMIRLLKRFSLPGFRKINPVAAFISIPKNASKTVLAILDLGPNRDQETTDSLVIYENHQRGAVLNSKYNLEDLFVFCFSRNPYDRCVSWYNYHHKMPPYNLLTFEAWVKEGMPHHWKKQNQTDYSKEGISPLLQYNFVDQCKVDFIGRMENFEQDLRTIIHRLNSICSEKSIPHEFKYSNRRLHASRKQYPSMDDHYTGETKEIVYRILKKDFLYFGYEG